MLNQRTIEISLTSNGFELSNRPERLGWLEPTRADLPAGQIWEQFQAQGYVWLKGILDRQAVLAFRRQFFEAYREVGLLAPGSDPQEGVYSGQREDPAWARQKLTEITRWADYEAFCLSSPIRAFYQQVLGGAVYLHKRKLIRYTLPGDPHSTGAHYDLVYLRAGTERVYTSWIPIGDTPVEMGGLVYLEGSDAWGRKQEAEFSALNADLPPEERISAYNKNMTDTGWLTRDLPSLAERLDTRWLAADYEAGDMMVHSPFMIHAATLNGDLANRMRLSTDIRYQLVQDEIDRRWAIDWAPGDEKKY
jgi:ectoine hydroxylase-related dioxygenase (phytanoyl-CoA dioxygenase family)